MWDSAVGVVLGLLCFTLIGLGPAYALVGCARPRLYVALAIAPSVGFALTTVVATLLVRLDQPVERWATGWLALGGLASATWFAAAVRLRRGTGEPRPTCVRALAWLIGATVAVLGLELLPMLAGGVQFVTLRGNGTDALNYLTMARYVDRQPYSWAFMVSDQQLIDANAAYLLARGLLSNRWPISAVLAWTADVGHVPLYRFEYAFSGLCLALAVGPVIALARQLGANRRVATIVGVAASVGFWPQLVLDMRAQSQLGSTCLLVLIALIWARVMAGKGIAPPGAIILLGTGLAGLVLTYLEISPILALGLGLSAVTTARDRAALARAIAHLLAAGLLALGLIAPLWTQLAAFVEQQLTALSTPNTWYLAYFAWLHTNPVVGFWGLATVALPDAAAHPRVLIVATVLVQVIGVGLLVAVGVRLPEAIRRISSSPAFATCASLCLVSLTIAALLMVRGQLWAAGKAVSFSYPFTMLVLVALWTDLPRPSWALANVGARALRSTVMAWVLVQCGLGLYRVYIAAAGTDYFDYISDHGEYRQHDWDLHDLETAIAGQDRPTVWLAVANHWVSEYLNLALSSRANVIDLYGVYDRNGNLAARQDVTTTPAFLVVEKRSWWNRDVLANTIVAQNRELALVQMTPSLTAPVLIGFNNPNGEEADIPSTHFFWLGSTPTQWLLIAPADENLVLTGQFTPGPNLANTDRLPAMRASIRPFDATDFTSQTFDAGRTILPVARGLNELDVQELDAPLPGGGGQGDPRTLTVGVNMLEATFVPQ